MIQTLANRGYYLGVSVYAKLLNAAKLAAKDRLGCDFNEIARRLGLEGNNSLVALISKGKLDLPKAVEMARLAGWGETQIEDLVWEGVRHKAATRRETRSAAEVLAEAMESASPADRIRMRRRIYELALTDNPERTSTESSSRRTSPKP